MSRLPQHVLDAAARHSSVKLALSLDLAQAGPSQLHRLIIDLADEMKNKCRAKNSFIKIDLPDFITGKGYLMISPAGQPMRVEEYRKCAKQRILGIDDRHPALLAIHEGKQPSEGDLIGLERVLHNELTNSEIQLSEKTVCQAYGMHLDNRAGFLGFVRLTDRLAA